MTIQSADGFPVRNIAHATQWRNVMKKILVLAVIATAFAGTPAFARGHGIGIGANVLTGRGGVIGLLDGRGALVVNTAVTTGKGGVLGAVLGRGNLLGGLLGGGCGCH
jgi:hypothetical protein